MKTVLGILFGLILLVVLLAAGILLYAFILEKKRPLIRIYEERAAEDDFAPYDSIPPLYIYYMLQIEDDRFFDHPGYSVDAIKEAWRINREKKRVVAGGSSLTQQLIKNLYFSFRHYYLRKAAEVVLAVMAEKKLGKRKILELYVNTAYFGFGVYGITDAARFYFGKELKDLSLNQIFIFACLLYAPTKGNPIEFPKAFETIRNRRMKYLRNENKITEEDAAQILQYDRNLLDPELRLSDGFTRNYPKDVPMENERFGPKRKVR